MSHNKHFRRRMRREQWREMEIGGTVCFKFCWRPC